MIRSIKLSLKDLLGKEYMEGVVENAVLFLGLKKNEALKLAAEKVEFYPGDYEKRADNLIKSIGTRVCKSLYKTASGAATDSFNKATNLKAAPLGGFAFFRIGEDGRLYLISKSEHYHASLGHNFPGYRLLQIAGMLGITNITHNNTRGFITRRLEEELIRTVNGLKKNDIKDVEKIRISGDKHILSRVLNLETGSLAVEAGIKMMLSRFYRLDKKSDVPINAGKTPVFLVMGDNEGGKNSNYHGTTIFAQMMRGMWPKMHEKAVKAGVSLTIPVSINDIKDFKKKFKKYNTGKYMIAGFLHEIIMMNYGGIKLKQNYLKKVYKICHKNNVPVLVDEIQSCIWYPGMYLFKLYGLHPDFVAIGKGFPGGQYPASKIIMTKEMDTLNQFGALVTNGQEELASLAYLITMAFAEANAPHINEIGKYYEKSLRKMAEKYKGIVNMIEGRELLSSICFKTAEQAAKFAELLAAEGIDISAQTYKANCPPAALTKLPIISTKKMVKYLICKMESAFMRMKTE